ncbi:MAG: DUF1569 domain-containing protein [Planctomycetaceae bacterium]
MPIDVRKVVGRRDVKIECCDDILRDAEQLMQGGRICSLGNWTVGHNFEHLAKAMDASIDGVDFTMPFWMRAIAKLFKSWFLNRPFKPGFQLLTQLESDFGPSPAISDDDGFRLLQKAVTRIKSTHHRAPSPAFGEMPESDWIKLHCRHAVLHFSVLLNE